MVDKADDLWSNVIVFYLYDELYKNHNYEVNTKCRDLEILCDYAGTTPYYCARVVEKFKKRYKAIEAFSAKDGKCRYKFFDTYRQKIYNVSCIRNFLHREIVLCDKSHSTQKPLVSITEAIDCWN